MDQEVEIVLVEVLTACARGFEVDHGLDGVGGRAREGCKGGAEARVSEVGEGQGVAAVGLEEAGVAFEGVGVEWIDGGFRVAVAAALDHGGEVVGEVVAFSWGEEGAEDGEAVAVVGSDGSGVGIHGFWLWRCCYQGRSSNSQLEPGSYQGTNKRNCYPDLRIPCVEVGDFSFAPRKGLAKSDVKVL